MVFIFYIYLNEECLKAFQDGCNAIVSKLTSLGFPPSSNGVADINSSIDKCYTDRYNKGVSDTKVGTATSSQVLTGYSFTNSSSIGINGSMPNRGTLNWNSSNTTYSVQPGYYSGGTLDSRTSYNNGYNSGYNKGKEEGSSISFEVPCTIGTDRGLNCYRIDNDVRIKIPSYPAMVYIYMIYSRASSESNYTYNIKFYDNLFSIHRDYSSGSGEYSWDCDGQFKRDVAGMFWGHEFNYNGNFVDYDSNTCILTFRGGKIPSYVSCPSSQIGGHFPIKYTVYF